MEDLLSDVSGKAEVAIGAASAGGVWIAARFNAWKKIESKPLKVAIAVCLFMAFVTVLSMIQSIF